MEKSGYLLRERKTKTYKVDFSDEEDEFDDDDDSNQPTSSVYCNNSASSRKRKLSNKKQQIGEIDPDFNERQFLSPGQIRKKPTFQQNNGLNNAGNNFGGRYVHIEPAPFTRVNPAASRISLKCVVDGCDGRLKSNPNRFAQVFAFPLSPVLLYLWKKAVKKKHLIWAPGPGDGVCANHFAPHDKPWLGDAPSQNLPSNSTTLPQLARMVVPMVNNVNNFRFPSPRDQLPFRPRLSNPAPFTVARMPSSAQNNINNINTVLVNFNSAYNNGCRKPLSPLKCYDPRPFLRPSFRNGSPRMGPPPLLPNVYQNVSTIIVNARPYEIDPHSITCKPNDVCEPAEIDTSNINDSILPGISVDYGDDDDEDITENEKDDGEKALSTDKIDDKNSKMVTEKDADGSLEARNDEKSEEQGKEETENFTAADDEAIFAAITVGYDEEGNAGDAGSDDEKASASTVSVRSDGHG